MTSEQSGPVVTKERMQAFRYAVAHNNDADVPWLAWKKTCEAFGLDPTDDRETQRLYDAIVWAADRYHGKGTT